MVVMAFLNRTNFAFKAKNLRAIFAHDTGWWRDRAECRVLAIFGLDMMMRPILKRQHLLTISTKSAVGWRHCADLFAHALCEGFKHFRMISKIPGFDKLN